MDIFFCSSLLDLKGSSASPKQSLPLSPWFVAAQAAGFDGIELLDRHYIKAMPEEQMCFRRSTFPIRIVRSEIDPAQDPAGFISTAETARKLRAKKLVFNVSSLLDDPDYVRLVLERTAKAFRGGRLVCECRESSALGEPEQLHGLYSDFRMAPFDLLIRPFQMTPEALLGWITRFGERVTHSHVALHNEPALGKSAALGEQLDRIQPVLDIMHKLNYRGTFSIEPTHAATLEQTNPFALFAGAKSDMEALRIGWNAADFAARGRTRSVASGKN